jgi:hypothetical protein
VWSHFVQLQVLLILSLLQGEGVLHDCTRPRQSPARTYPTLAHACLESLTRLTFELVENNSAMVEWSFEVMLTVALKVLSSFFLRACRKRILSHARFSFSAQFRIFLVNARFKQKCFQRMSAAWAGILNTSVTADAQSNAGLHSKHRVCWPWMDAY